MPFGSASVNILVLGPMAHVSVSSQGAEPRRTLSSQAEPCPSIKRACREGRRKDSGYEETSPGGLGNGIIPRPE